ncbi:D-2-hydroxyacid dehydrogenase [Anaerosporobacter faecicola]|uniref:D-2-hydroxyacid dehydrogenase n=1 Tax=Anaerosporobacter faecicola TaxID=2718714 RepID=UPI00143C17DE|nr:D-2-hydroxyacid dehydrogenase [Anaerosporobacter faecicola]
MKIVCLEANCLGNDVDLTCLQEFGEVVQYGSSTVEETIERVKDAEVIVVNKVPMNADTLAGATNLKVICVTATGTNIIDTEYTNGRNITVMNVKGYSTDAVVQHTFALLFYIYEKLNYYDCFVKSGEYVKNDIFSHFDKKFFELKGKRWGIIGLGEIGKGVAKVAEAFGCKVWYYSTSGKNHDQIYEQVSLEKLLQESDIISIHAPLNEQTTNLITKKELSQMKKTAVLLNLGRGSIINEADLADALEEELIAGAALDVLAKEPMAADNPLLRVQDSTKLIITPHIAWAPVETRRRVVEEVCMNMRAYLAGEERNVVK